MPFKCMSKVAWFRDGSKVSLFFRIIRLERQHIVYFFVHVWTSYSTRFFENAESISLNGTVTCTISFSDDFYMLCIWNHSSCASSKHNVSKLLRKHMWYLSIKPRSLIGVLVVHNYTRGRSQLPHQSMYILPIGHRKQQVSLCKCLCTNETSIAHKWTEILFDKEMSRNNDPFSRTVFTQISDL